MEPDLIGLEVGRLAAIASILEPLSDKPGCTTRNYDRTPHSRLEHFQIAGANILIPIGQLHTAVRKDQDCAPFSFACMAMEASFANRPRAKINFGVIHLLVPLVVAHALGAQHSNEFKEISSRYLRTSNRADLMAYEAFVGYFFRLTPNSSNENFLKYCPMEEKYRSIHEVEEAARKNGHGNATMGRELTSGFPLSRRGAELILSGSCPHSAARRFYDELRTDYGCASVGTRADIICASIFLSLCMEPERLLVFEGDVACC